MFGIFKIDCSNGLLVASKNLGEVSVIHKGDIISDVIDKSFGLIERAPEVARQVDEWRQIELNRRQQQRYIQRIQDYVSLGRSKVDPNSLLEARRPSDDVDSQGNRDLWHTMNVVQENITRGGIVYETSDGKFQTSRPMKAIRANGEMNKRLWEVTENYVGVLSRMGKVSAE
jgi:hypothetical protein